MTDIINPKPTEAERPTATATVLGRQFQVRMPTDAQMGRMEKLERVGLRAERLGMASKDEAEREQFWRELLRSAGDMVEILISLAVDPDVREWLSEHILTGDLDVEGLFPIIQAFRGPDAALVRKPGAKAIRAR